MCHCRKHLLSEKGQVHSTYMLPPPHGPYARSFLPYGMVGGSLQDSGRLEWAGRRGGDTIPGGAEGTQNAQRKSLSACVRVCSCRPFGDGSNQNLALTLKAHQCMNPSRKNLS